MNPRKLVARGRTLACLLFGLVAAGALSGQDAQTVVRMADKASPATTSRMRTEMTIYPRVDDTSNARLFVVDTYGGRESESYVEFLEPRSIRGLKVLTLGDDIRVYFPSTGRVRRITGSSKGGSIGGTGGDFSYEDISGGKYLDTYTDFRMVAQDDQQWIIEAIPTDKDSSYSRVALHISRQNLLSLVTEYYTAKDGLLKTLKIEEARQIDGRFVPVVSRMTNHAKGQMTVITLRDASFGIEIDDKYFNPNRFYR